MTDEISYEDVQDWMHPFPEPEQVFAGDIAAHRRVLQPLLSIDASIVDPAWSGRLHFVTPIEPDEGLLGDGTEDVHSGYCRTNWIGFRVAGSRYQFLGDWKYFKINRPDLRDRDWHEKGYAEKEASYRETKQVYEETGRLRPPSNRALDVAWFEQIGGAANYGNWSNADEFPIDEEEDDEGDLFAHPLTLDGRRFRFVGSLEGYSYRENSADSILLFFDPETSTAVLTFDYT